MLRRCAATLIIYETPFTQKNAMGLRNNGIYNAGSEALCAGTDKLAARR